MPNTFDVVAFEVLALIDADISMNDQTINSGATETFDFTYRAGIPRATAFSANWYNSQTDATDATNEDTSDVPTQTFTPTVPAADTGSNQTGMLAVTAPAVNENTSFYLRLGITQE